MDFYPNTFWLATAQEGWPDDRDDNIYLGRAACRVGKALFAGSWSDEDFMQLGAPDPDALVPAADAVEHFLALSQHRRDVLACDAGQRALAVATRILAAAADRKLILFSRCVQRGDDWQPVSHLKIDRARSMHIFRRCAFDPAKPLDASIHVRDAHAIFVSRGSMDRLVRGLQGPRVSEDVLARWVLERTSSMNQGQIIEASKTAFPNHRPPTQDEVIKADAAIRAAGKMPPRRRGNPGRLDS